MPMSLSAAWRPDIDREGVRWVNWTFQVGITYSD